MKMIQKKVKALLVATFLLLNGAWPQRCSSGESDFSDTTSTVVVPNGDGHWYLILIGILLALAIIGCILYVKWPSDTTDMGYPHSRKERYSGHRTYCDKDKFSSPYLPGRGDSERRTRYATQAANIPSKTKANTTHQYIGFAQTIMEKSKETKRVVGDVVRVMEELSATTGQLRRTTSFIKGYAVQSRMAVVSATTNSVSMAATGSIDIKSADNRTNMCSPRELAEKTVSTAEEATLLVERFQGNAMKGLELAWDLQTKIRDVHGLMCRALSPSEIGKKSDGSASGSITESSDEVEANNVLDDFFTDITDLGLKTSKRDNGFRVDTRWPR